MKKSYAILIALVLVLPMLLVVAPANASSGTVQLGVTNGSTVYIGDYNVSVAAGSMSGATTDTLYQGNFTIIFDNVTFSGTQFNLYISTNGFDNITGDQLYASTFSVSDLHEALHAVNVTTPLSQDPITTFYIGMVGGHEVIEGPIPYWITPNYMYIKVWDGSSGAVASSVQTVNILPALTLTPSSGPGGETVTLTGVALTPNTLYNITYGNSTTAAAQVTTDVNGTFTFTWNIEDLCNDFNNTQVIEIDLINNATTAWTASVFYTEFPRYLEVVSTTYEGTDIGPFANMSETTYADVLDTLSLEGLYFNPNAALTFTIDNTQAWTPTSLTSNSTGWFNATFTVPILAQGEHNVTISNGGCNYVFYMVVEPTLIVTPNSGPIGTNVTFTCYGLTPGNVYIYWESDGVCGFPNEYTWVANATVGSDGQFNVTVPWTIPATTGGYMYFYADYGYTSNTSGYDYSGAYAVYLLTPTLTVTPSSFATDGSLFTITGTGLIPNTPYTIDIDNQAFAMPNYFSYTYNYGNLLTSETDTGTVQFADSVVWSTDCGNLTIQLVAAGFYPGEHVVALYTSPEYAGAFGGPYDGGFYTYGFGNYSLNAYATFTVTAANDSVVNAILSGLNASIISIENGIATINTTTGTIQTEVSNLNATVTSMNGNVATVSTNVGTIQGTVTSIQGDVATIKTDVGTIQATTSTIKGNVPADLWPVWIAVILALIAAIAAIYVAIVIRSKIAA